MVCLQVWNSDTSEEARKGIQSDLVSDEPEMRLLYTTPGNTPAVTATLIRAHVLGLASHMVVLAACAVTIWTWAFATWVLQALLVPHAAAAHCVHTVCMFAVSGAESLRHPSLRGYLKVSPQRHFCQQPHTAAPGAARRLPSVCRQPSCRAQLAAVTPVQTLGSVMEPAFSSH